MKIIKGYRDRRPVLSFAGAKDLTAKVYQVAEAKADIAKWSALCREYLDVESRGERPTMTQAAFDHIEECLREAHEFVTYYEERRE